MKKVLLPILFFITVCTVFAQFGEPLDLKISGYDFKTRINQEEYITALTVSKGTKNVFEKEYYDIVSSITEQKLTKGGKQYIFIDLYSGGAHCCSSLLIGELGKESFKILDSVFLGNSGYIIDDIENDGVKEIITGNDMFAYAFTNYAETRFPTVIYHFEDNKLENITADYKDYILGEIDAFRKDLAQFTKTGFECPLTEDEDTFNTEAGSVKTILAAIVADYYSIGEVGKGYELVNKVYKCVDRDKYIKILKEDFKLK